MPAVGEYIPAERLRSFLTFALLGATRQANGIWTFHLQTEGGAEIIGDGRQIIMNKQLASRATEQRGRRRSRTRPAA